MELCHRTFLLVEKIIETIETGTFDTMIWPVYFGGEAINGIGHVLVTPQPVYEALGLSDHRVVKMYTAEDVETLANAIFAGR